MLGVARRFVRLFLTWALWGLTKCFMAEAAVISLSTMARESCLLHIC